jgi:hypothetical protein
MAFYHLTISFTLILVNILPVLNFINRLFMERRFDLDWLRVFAFAVLIFYHIGMLYVADWGFHYKSQYQSEFLQNIMLLINRWRLPLLFFISGVASRYLLEKYSFIYFAKARTWRLLLPLLFGVLVIVPPQLYVEMTAKGDLNINYWDFYNVFFDIHNTLFADYKSGILPHMDVNHLWYLRELWCFSLILILIHPMLSVAKIDKNFDLIGNYLGFSGVLILPIVFLSVSALSIFPESAEGIRIARGFTFFLLGYVIWQRESCWQPILKHRRCSLGLALTSYVGLLWYYHTILSSRTEPLDAIYEGIETTLLLANRWVWVLAILGYAYAYLNKPSSVLRYLSRAVYPSYLLHQSVLIVAAFSLSSLMLGYLLEVFWVSVITLISCLASYEVFKGIAIFRPLLGISSQNSGAKISLIHKIFELMGWLLILTLGYLIIF